MRAFIFFSRFVFISFDPDKIGRARGRVAEALAEELATLYYAFRFINLDLRSL